MVVAEAVCVFLLRLKRYGSWHLHVGDKKLSEQVVVFYRALQFHNGA